jgi:uncharacterized protein
VDLSFYPLLNKEEPLVNRFLELNDELKLTKRLFVLLEGEEEKLDEVLVELKQSLEKREDVQQVLYPPSFSWLEENAPWIVTDEQFNTWVSVTSEPLQLEKITKLEQSLEKEKEQLLQLQQKISGSRFALIILEKDPMNQPIGKSSCIDLKLFITSFSKSFNVTSSVTGLPAITSEDQSRTFDRITLLSPLSLLSVLFILSYVERRWKYLLLITMPMLLAMGATFGIVGTITGKITMLETVFGVMIFGLGVDFALHLITRFQKEHQQSNFQEALQKTIAGTGFGVIAGGVTTIGAFAIISTAPDPEALHLGLSGAVGLSICLLLMITFLPACWVLLDGKEDIKQPPIIHKVPFIIKAANFSCNRPIFTVGSALIFSCLCLIGTKNFHIQTDLEQIFNRKVPAVIANQKLQEKYELNFNPWVFQADTLEETRRIHREVEQSAFISRVDSLALLFPENSESRHQRLQETKQQRFLQQQSTMSMMSMAALSGGDDRLFYLLKGQQILDNAQTTGPPTLEAIPEFLKAQLLSTSGKFLVLAYPHKASLDGKQLHIERTELEKISPKVAGLGTAIEGILYIERPWLWTTFGLVVLFVGGLLYTTQRSIRWIFLTLIPVGFGCICTFGILCWYNLDFNPITLMALPLIIGLGIDDGIHVVHRMREEDDISPSEAAGQVGQPILMTTLTSCASFGTLLLTDHPGMESLGLVLLIGLPLCLLASITILPASAILLRVSTRHSSK